jgi:DNA-binding IclR family transcriptional regulator
VGDRVSLHGTAIGKALLSKLASADRSRLLRLEPLRRLTDDTTTDVTSLEKEITEHHSRGWHCSRGEGAPGVWSLGIADYVGTTLVGLSMIGPADRMKANHDLYLDALLTIHKTLFSAQGAAGSGASGPG